MHWYLPLAEKLAAHKVKDVRPLLIGINGCQGSGKSTLAALLSLLFTSRYKLNAVCISVDDFYLTRDDRLKLADNVHQLFRTRGVPGTHDIPLMQQTLQKLLQAKSETVAIPGFNKAIDDRRPQSEWDAARTPLDIIIFEGWFIGTSAQVDEELAVPVNVLEAREDKDSIWRRYVNQQVKTEYKAIYELVDIWVMLKAPSFDAVYQWRLEQEEKLANKNHHTTRNRIMTPDQIAHFIQHYQRLTEHALTTLPAQVNYLFNLNANREVISCSEPVCVKPRNIT